MKFEQWSLLDQCLQELELLNDLIDLHEESHEWGDEIWDSKQPGF